MAATNIRPLELQDIEVLGNLSFPWSTREKTVAKWSNYLDEQQKGTREVCLVEQQGEIIGYGNLLPASEYLHFRQDKIPEINDVWVYEENRKKGIATADERKRRLVARGQANLADENMMNWAGYLRKECQDRGYIIIQQFPLALRATEC